MGRGLVKSDLREKTHLLDGAKLGGVTGKGRTLTWKSHSSSRAQNSNRLRLNGPV